ncbi:amino acid permease [Hymenobacter coccineus]|uniref:amino acid permease n=1 Tax=Hymenobacter coccineus TaxID=1908235 RepID=UPI000AABA3CA|nr:amino acid permease [Hymenobacter coccineus]
MPTPAPSAASGLKKALTPLHLWALAVGLVISGEYFGWNYGWAVAGPVGFLVATGLVTVLYVAFVFSFTELTTALPSAGGPFVYAHRAFGPLGGLVAGYATLVEFLFTPPAIAFALGSYVHFLAPAVPVLGTALGCYVVFTLLNLRGIKESATFSLVATGLAVAELLLYLGLVAPHFTAANFLAHPVRCARAGCWRRCRLPSGFTWPSRAWRWWPRRCRTRAAPSRRATATAYSRWWRWPWA